MTLLLNIGTAFAVFLVSVIILSSNYKTIWPAPNFVTHSANFDYVFQDIAKHSFIETPIEIEYAYKSVPIATPSATLITSNQSDHEALKQHQAVLEKHSNLHHLLHIPPWALVPDRIATTSGSVDDLFHIFDSLKRKQEQTLSVLSEMIEIIPTHTLMKTQMEKLTPSQKYWIKNMTEELFNASQTIFSYQVISYADEIQEWVQNSEQSNQFLRLLFERTRGWPLLYNPSIPQQTDAMAQRYQDLCVEITELINSNQQTANPADMITVEQCELLLDNILPWLPDRSPTLSTMWPTYYEVQVEALKKIEGVNSAYTLVVRQNRKPSGEMLHYVSSKGDERIQVEWFNEQYHLRATNLAFVRRIRIQIKRIANILKNSVTLSGEMEHEDEIAALWASLEEDAEEGPKPSDRHIEQLPPMFKEYVKAYANELEKGQFEKILDMDLTQNDEAGNRDIFIHGLPSMAVFHDGGIKRAWNFILGIVDHRGLIADNAQTRSSEMAVINAFVEAMEISSFQSKRHLTVHGIELEIVGVWPFAVAGYLRAITPEVATYVYPPFADAKKRYGKQRCVVLLDVMDKLYVNNMRQIGIQRLVDNNEAKLITLKSTMKYVSNLLHVEHRWFHNRNDYTLRHSVKQALFIRLSAFVGCVQHDDDVGADTYGCVLSGVMYNILEAFNRDNRDSLLFLAFLEKEGLIEWQAKSEQSKKDVLKIMSEQVMVQTLRDASKWESWKSRYFIVEEEEVNNVLNEFVNDNKKMKVYMRSIRHVSKYSIVRRPGEDTFTLSASS